MRRKRAGVRPGGADSAAGGLRGQRAVPGEDSRRGGDTGRPGQASPPRWGRAAPAAAGAGFSAGGDGREPLRPPLRAIRGAQLHQPFILLAQRPRPLLAVGAQEHGADDSGLRGNPGGRHRRGEGMGHGARAEQPGHGGGDRFGHRPRAPRPRGQAVGEQGRDTRQRHRRRRQRLCRRLSRVQLGGNLAAGSALCLQVRGS